MDNIQVTHKLEDVGGGTIIHKLFVRFPFINHSISAKKLEETLPSSIVDNCYFCDYPVYEKSFILINDELSLVTSFFKSTDFGKTELVILSYTPHTLWNKKLEYKHYTEEVEVKLMNFEKKMVINLDNCFSTRTYKAQYITSIHCKVNLEEDLDGCFFVDVKEVKPKKRDLLIHPIPVRHCELEGEREKSKIGIVLMINQAYSHWILEYLVYHYMIGISHVYVYAHLGYNNSFYDTTIFELLDYFIVREKLTLFLWPYSKPINYRPDYWSSYTGDLRAAYTDALHRYGNKYEWLVFTDDDEFIVPVGWEKNKNQLFDVLEEYKGYDNLLLNSWIYSRFRNKKPSELAIEIYPEFDEKIRAYRKSIIKTKNCVHMNNHECNLDNKNMYRETIAGKCPRSDKECKMIDDNKLHIAHYWYKKYHPFNKKKDLETSNIPIIHLLPELKKKLEEVKSEINYEKYNFDYEIELPRTELKNALKFPHSTSHNVKREKY